MKTVKKLFFIILLSTLSFACNNKDRYVISDVINYQAKLFPLEDIRLLDGPFKHAQDMEELYLLDLEPDRLLHRFRLFAGLEPKGENYGGWEQMSLSGHSLGHYLTACVLTYQATGNEELKNRVHYIVDELAQCQVAQGNGYIGGIPRQDTFWIEVASGDIRSAGFDLNGAWAPWYTLHKMMAGLIDAYSIGDKQALDVLVKFSDWVCNSFEGLTDEQFQKMLDCEYGGMNEMMAEVYALTGNNRYLDMSLRFNHKKVLDPLAEGRDILPGKHANTQIPKIIGTSRQYELTADEKQYKTTVFFWNTVVNHHSYVTGGNSNGEYFGPPDQLNDRLSPSTTETCNTYNMLKLTRRLFCWEAKPEHGDYYERALYNHILASQNPDDGMCCYFVPLKSGTQKTYNNRYHSFSCCSGTGMENHSKYGEAIYFKSKDDGIYLNLFIPSTLNWHEKGIKLTMETDYPASGKIRLKFEGRKNSFPIYVRYPSWAGNSKDQALKVIGSKSIQTLEDNGPGSWVKIEGEWKNGDEIEINIPFGFRTESMPDNPNRAAIFYGPIILAAALGSDEPDPILGIPVLLTDERPVESWLQQVEGSTMAFRTVGVGQPKDMTLIPFYALHHQKHIVYFDFFTQETWKNKQKEFEAERKRQHELELLTIDWVQPGEMQPERDHNQQGEHSNVGEFGGKKFREAHTDGWFSYDVKVNPRIPMTLQCTWWGSDGGRREFDIFVDDVLLTTESLRRKHPNQFYVENYALPLELVRDKSKITIKFLPKPGNTAGGLFGLRIVK